MNRAYHKWYSNALERDMELLVFGDRGAKVIFFPTRKAHFYDYENWDIINSLKHRIESGQLHVYCVDSVDADSFYSKTLSPAERILYHFKYEKYITEEVLPFAQNQNNSVITIAAGCSLGAYHAVNISFRFPHLFNKVVGMSGRYDLTQAMGSFQDLFSGYVNDDIVMSMPNKYIQQLNDTQLENIRKLKIVLAIGNQDAFLADNLFFSDMLNKKNIPHEFIIWNGEAHNPDQWKDMVQFYL